MKVVVISGSPRKNANTQIIMKYVNEYVKLKNPWVLTRFPPNP